MKYSSYYTYQKYCNIGGQGYIPAYPNVYTIDNEGTLVRRLHKSNDNCCNDLPAIYRTTSGSPYCDSSYNKCIDSYTEISYDNGETWEFYSSGTTIVEYDSEYCRAFRWVNMDIDSYYICEHCGVTPPTFKARGYTAEGTQFSVDCNNSTLIHSDTPLSAVTVEVGDCVSVLDENAFKYPDYSHWPTTYHPKNFNSVYIPSTINSIPASAFTNMVSLVSCTLPKTLTSIGDSAFYHCIQLFYLDLWDNITSIGEYAFYDCDSLTSVHIPTGLTSISRSCFCKCGGLVSVDIPDSVTSIGYNAFDSCGIEYLTLGNNVTGIGNSAFYNCKKLKYATIGNGIIGIGTAAFSGCTSLESITIYATTPPTLWQDAFSMTSCTIYVPAESVNAYKAAYGWSSYKSRIQPIQT